MKNLILSAREKANEGSFDEALKIWDVGHYMGFFHTDSKAAAVKQGGLLNHRKQHFIWNMVSKYNLCFIGLFESKKESIDIFLVRKLWPNLGFDFSWVPSVGSSGGLFIIWNTVLLQNIEMVSGTRWICLDFMFDSLSIRHILIYVSNLASERLSLWNDLLPLLIYPGLVFISGDFNEVLAPTERFNCLHYSPSMLALRDILNDSELVDLPLHGRSFTWQNSLSKSRIDRCFSSLSAKNIWRSSSLTSLPRGLSDHVPLLFQSNDKFD
ncbi:uncharacterized protein LOC126656955 [Mercurialis annua]|uniref:uncharacterized protein LOC126656955 n=1 Tax=Mercurialis annua TaxID=3986 RepID=UPI00215DDB87|nr:uncharacterized protein LOC126656955 [Mercurialis annua]